jgi:RNA polymerase sigma-70 factor (ECF subfamily)
VLATAERARLTEYTERFNARDFDAIRDMLADEIRLELVNRTRMKGRKEVATYFSNYSSVSDWWLEPALIDGRPAVLVRASADPSAPPSYFIVLEWSEDKIIGIRDFRYARYAVDSADVMALR